MLSYQASGIIALSAKNSFKVIPINNHLAFSVTEKKTNMAKTNHSYIPNCLGKINEVSSIPMPIIFLDNKARDN